MKATLVGHPLHVDCSCLSITCTLLREQVQALAPTIEHLIELVVRTI